jgi:hypothetical protein
MTSLYFYKLTADNNGAPCLDKNGSLLSLAICKPMIRSTAEPGDLIFGFAADSLCDDNRLLYIARITAKERNGGYYTKLEYLQREDCIYERRGDRFAWRDGALHHGCDDIEHDIGMHPNYEKASVLLSSDFRYFGKNGSADYKNRYPLIKEAIEKLRDGHRVNHDEQLRTELQKLKDQVWEETRQDEIGEPTSGSRRGVCHRAKSCGVV